MSFSSKVLAAPWIRSSNATLPICPIAQIANPRPLSRVLPGDTMSDHGFRAMACTVLDEMLGYRPDFIEHQLAHTVKDPNGRAYNRAAHLAERRKMMQGWADYLDAPRPGGDVVPIKRKRG